MTAMAALTAVTADLPPLLSAQDWQAVGLSVQVALVACLACLPVAMLPAYALARWRFWGHGLLNALVHVPLVLPPVVTGYILLGLFGRQGAIGAWLDRSFGIAVAFHWTGAALAAALMALPLMVRALRLSIEAVDLRLLAAAQTLGAPPLWVFARLTLPMIWPGILAALILGFAKALGEFGATITFVGAIPGQTLTIPSAIHLALQTPGQEAAARALAGISLAIALGALLVAEHVARRAAGHVARP
jgi:molybdate transport system permease protein